MPPSSEHTTGFLQGITRGKRLLVLVGQKKALGIAVHNDRPQRRYSGLLTSLKGRRGACGSAVESKTDSQSEGNIVNG